jgi:NTP pyrophosphatase (non-canonical NTP hydrolase)
LTLNEYHRLAYRTARERESGERALLVAALGLAGESGEFAELVKKHLFHDHPFDRDKAIKEVGDVLWYVAQACTALGIQLEEVAEKNINKLKERYPEGFTSERSIHRNV